MNARWAEDTEELVALAIHVADCEDSWEECRTWKAHGRAVREVLAKLADAGLLGRVRTWREGDPEPDVPAVRDDDNDVWLKVDGGWRHRYGKQGAEPWTWTQICEYAPIVEIEIPDGSPE